MSEDFPQDTGNSVTIATRHASQRVSFYDESLGIQRIGQKQIPVEFGTFAVMSHASISLRRHYGPAVCYERTDFVINAHREGSPSTMVSFSTADLWGSHER